MIRAEFPFYSIQSLLNIFPQHDQNLGLITESGSRHGIEWGNVRERADDSTSSSSSGGSSSLKDNAVMISVTPSVLQKSGDVVQVGRERRKEEGNGEGRGA